MNFGEKLKDVQQKLAELQVDGWLLYDFQHSNKLACEFLEIGPQAHLTRRFFYWIPARGTPIQIVHAIEGHVLNHFPGEIKRYSSWQILEKHLGDVLRGKSRVAMEYSPRNGIPYISKVDGGTLETVRSYGVAVVSSASFLQYYTSVLTEFQVQSHLEAACVLEETVTKTWKWIRLQLEERRHITEYDVQQYMLGEIHAQGHIMDGEPICGVNQNSASPHYAPSKTNAAVIKPGDFILIDLWCKKNAPRAVFADITRVAVAAPRATARQEQIFSLVRTAQKRATDWIRSRFANRETVRGCEVDEVCRKVIAEAGFGAYFTHRTGHNIYTELHGPGAHLDSLETWDERPLIPGTCFSVEPGIYLPGEFGVRLEHDVYLPDATSIQITGGTQESIVLLL
jgi:Xaa-Pro aminopeptidase